MRPKRPRDTNQLAKFHKSLRVTPAMQAGIADHVWTLEEIAKLAD